MGCCDSTPANLDAAALDPTKHVNYVLGMVLGEDDFRQEFAYHQNRDQWLARDLIGYGTVRGLDVSVEPGDKGPRVRVEAGAALSSQGQLICVPSAQCADINGWLASHDDAVRRRLGSPPGALKVYVALCYRDCQTDAMPIPGEPCRSDAELTQATRLADDFCLKLMLDRPRQREEDAIRNFCLWLRQIDMRDNGQPSTDKAVFLGAIRDAAQPWLGSPPASPPASPPGDFLFGSPPASLHIAPADVIDYLRIAFELWTTELRPKFAQCCVGCAPNCPDTKDDGDCCPDPLLLAQITLDLVAKEGALLLDSDKPLPQPADGVRPYVLHLRMVQEWLLGALGQSAVPVAGNSVVAATAFGQAPAAGTSEDYSRADHDHGLPVLPDLAGDVTGAIAGNTVAALRGIGLAAAAPAAGDVLTFQNNQWTPQAPANANIPSPGATVADETSFGLAAAVGASADYARADHTHGTPALNGDVVLDGDSQDNLIVALQRRKVDALNPQAGQLLGFDGNAWVPVAPPQAGGGQFVGRPIKQAFNIVAAGWVTMELDFASGQDNPLEGQEAKVTPTYNRLQAITPHISKGGGVRFTFPKFSPDSTYIVKLTPWLLPGQESIASLQLFFTGFFPKDQPQAGVPPGFTVAVAQRRDDRFRIIRFMIEVSEFERDG